MEFSWAGGFVSSSVYGMEFWGEAATGRWGLVALGSSCNRLLFCALRATFLM